MTKAMQEKLRQYNAGPSHAEEMLWTCVKELTRLHDTFDWLESSNTSMRAEGISDARSALRHIDSYLDEIRTYVETH